MKPKSGRTIPLYFKVSPEEKAVKIGRASCRERV